MSTGCLLQNEYSPSIINLKNDATFRLILIVRHLLFHRGHHILLFLAQTVARQTNEQLQYVPNRNSQAESTKSRSGSNVRGKVHSVTPPIDYELEPPKFAKTSLSHILKNWKALKSMVLFGCNSTGSKRYFTSHFLLSMIFGFYFMLLFNYKVSACVQS